MFRIESCVKQHILIDESTTACSRKGRLLRFESNSTVTSDGGGQKLGNDVRRDPESITTKVCSQIGRK